MIGQSGKKTAISYAWVILAVIFVGQVATFGMRAAFGAYISPWERDFAVGRTVVTSISTLSFVVFAVAQPPVGKLNDHFGKNLVPTVSIFLMGLSLLLTSWATQIWQVFALFGVTFSLGVAGCSNSVSVTIITNWFVEKRGFALGLSMVGAAIGQLILVPANLFIIDRLGWRATLAALSIIIMAVVGPLFIFFLRCSPGEKGLRPYGDKEAGGDDPENERSLSGDRVFLPIFSVFKLKTFWKLTIPFFICGFTDVGIIQTHLIPMSEGKGIPVSVVAIAFSLIAISNIAGTIVTGHLSDHFSRTRQLAVVYAIRGATYVLLLVLQRPALLLVFAVIYGTVDMASGAPTNSLAVQLFDRFSPGALLGVISVCHQIGGAVGSWAPGLLYDMTGSYSAVLVISVIMLIAGALITLRIPECGQKR